MQLTGFVVALLLVPAAAAAQPESRVGSRVALYHDDDATTVVTSAVEAQAGVGERLALRAGALVDVVTTASVDVVAAASRKVEETREEVRAGMDLYGDDSVLSVDWAHSVEIDYSAHRAALGGAIDLAQHATRLSGALGLVLSEVGRAGDEGFSASQRAHVLSLGVTQVLDARTLLSVGYQGQLVLGMQSSPYRYVQLADGSVVPELHPDLRVRHAVVVRLRRALGEHTAVGLDERLYADDWGIVSSTTTATLSLEVGEDLDLALENRMHVQSGASFWETGPQSRRRYVTSDRELSPLFDDFFGPTLSFARPDVGPFARVRLDARVQGFYYRFLDPERIESRLGTLVSLGLEAVL